MSKRMLSYSMYYLSNSSNLFNNIACKEELFQESNSWGIQVGFIQIWRPTNSMVAPYHPTPTVREWMKGSYYLKHWFFGDWCCRWNREHPERHNVFCTWCTINQRVFDVSIDHGSKTKCFSTLTVTKLGLKTKAHPSPYKIGKVEQGTLIHVTEPCLVSFFFFFFGNKYKDVVLCDVMEMDVCHMILVWMHNTKGAHPCQNCWQARTYWWEFYDEFVSSNVLLGKGAHNRDWWRERACRQIQIWGCCKSWVVVGWTTYAVTTCGAVDRNKWRSSTTEGAIVFQIKLEDEFCPSGGNWCRKDPIVVHAKNGWNLLKRSQEAILRNSPENPVGELPKVLYQGTRITKGFILPRGFIANKWAYSGTTLPLGKKLDCQVINKLGWWWKIFTIETQLWILSDNKLQVGHPLSVE